MTKAQYEVFEALNPFFKVVMEGLRGLVDGNHYFDTIAEDAFFEFRYHFPGWPLTIRGRANRRDCPESGAQQVRLTPPVDCGRMTGNPSIIR
jgi:ketosteroid isomerase-like protein